MNDLKLLQIFYPFLKPYRWQIFLATLVLPLCSFTYSVQPLIMQRAIDGPLAHGDLSGLWVYVVALFAVVIANFFLQIYQFLVMNKVGQNAVANIRLALFDHLEKLSMSFFDRTPVGRSVSRITSDMEQLAESFVGGFVLIMLDIFNILGILIFMFWLNWQLSLAVSIFLIPVYFITDYYQEMYRQANLDSRRELAKLNSFLQQNVVGISVVQALNSAQKSMEKFAKNNLRYFKANDESIKADAQLSAAIEAVSIIAIAALIYMCSLLIYHGPNFSFANFLNQSLTMGMIVAFIQYAQSLFEPIRNLSDRFTVVQSAFTSIERMQELLAEPEEIKDPISTIDAQASATTANPIIEFSNVSFKYSTEDSHWILRGLNFKVEPGQKVALVGRTGSGKSTIIKLLTRLYEVQEGAIKVNGIDIRDYKQHELREMITVIHQDSYIFAGDLESNISLGRDVSKLDMNLAKPFLKAAPNLSADIQLSERGVNISSGEEQVLNFARAVVTNPPVLVLDEATAKIDLKTEKQIQTAMQEFLQGKTAVIIAHRLETIRKCDLILCLDHGRIVESGTHEELMFKNGVYKKLIDAHHD